MYTRSGASFSLHPGGPGADGAKARCIRNAEANSRRADRLGNEAYSAWGLELALKETPSSTSEKLSWDDGAGTVVVNAKHPASAKSETIASVDLRGVQYSSSPRHELRVAFVRSGSCDRFSCLLFNRSRSLPNRSISHYSTRTWIDPTPCPYITMACLSMPYSDNPLHCHNHSKTGRSSQINHSSSSP